MSSINPGGQGPGNSIRPGVPGADAADEWSLYPARQDVDFGGFTITNAVIEDISQTLVDETLKGTTTLFSGHSFGGTGTFNDAVSVNGGLTANTATITGGATITNGLALNNPVNVNFGAIQLKTGGNPDIYMGLQSDPSNDTYGYMINGATSGIGDFGLSINGKSTTGTTFDNLATFYGLGANTVDFPNTGGFKLDVPMKANENITVDANLQATNLTATTNIVGNTLTANSSVVCDALTANSASISEATLLETTSSVVRVGTIDATQGIGGEDPAVSISGRVNELKVRGLDSEGYTGQWGLHQAGGIKPFANLALTYNANTLELTTPNELTPGVVRERVIVFAGGADSGNLDSYGIFCKNPSNNYVGFAHSEINGVKQYSFTAHHQSQYTGDITDEHLGMVVESTGKIVGLQAKDKLYMGIRHENPEYSNATPVVRLASTQKSKKVLGVITAVKDEPDTTTGSLTIAYDGSGYNVGDKRVMVNAIGEGLIWVANTNGVVMNGDLLQSSSVPGYAEKQTDDVMRSSTIGKATMDCDFIQEEVAEKIILQDDDGNNVLDSQGRLIWVNGHSKQEKYKMRYLPGGRKACLVGCVYYCG